MKGDAMTKVKITYFGPLKYLLGLDEEWVEVDCVKLTVEDLLTHLSIKHGKLFSPMFSDGSLCLSNINIFINGKHIVEYKEKNAAIHDGSEISVVLVSQAAGG